MLDKLTDPAEIDVCLHCGHTQSNHQPRGGLIACPVVAFSFSSKSAYDAAIRNSVMREFGIELPEEICPRCGLPTDNKIHKFSCVKHALLKGT